MSILMNILWLLLGGIITAVEYVIASLGMMITIIGIPFGIQTLKLSFLALCPFGKRVETTPQAGGCLSIIMNILWILLGGIWISSERMQTGSSHPFMRASDPAAAYARAMVRRSQ